MFFNSKKKRALRDASKEAEIQAIRKSTFKNIENATNSMRKLNKLLGDKSSDVTLNIFLATGGDERHGK